MTLDIDNGTATMMLPRNRRLAAAMTRCVSWWISQRFDTAMPPQRSVDYDRVPNIQVKSVRNITSGEAEIVVGFALQM
jgi:hypothetical protein